MGIPGFNRGTIEGYSIHPPVPRRHADPSTEGRREIYEGLKATYGLQQGYFLAPLLFALTLAGALHIIASCFGEYKYAGGCRRVELAVFV